MVVVVRASVRVDFLGGAGLGGEGQENVARGRRMGELELGEVALSRPPPIGFSLGRSTCFRLEACEHPQSLLARLDGVGPGLFFP